jgi:hypothetical protein
MPRRKITPPEHSDLIVILAKAIKVLAIDVPILRAVQDGNNLVIILSNGVSKTFPLDYAPEVEDLPIALASTVLGEPL